jgi:hypothetical protein
MGLNEQIMGQKEYPGQPHIQANQTTVGGVFHNLKHIAREVFFNKTTDAPIVTSPAGWTTPNPVILHGIPTGPVITGVPDIRTNDAPKSTGGCK